MVRRIVSRAMPTFARILRVAVSAASFLLMETGDRLLLESGDKIELE